MRITYAIYAEVSLEGVAPGFFDSVKHFGFCQGLERGNFRARLKIGEIEQEELSESTRIGGRQLVERLGTRLLLPALRVLLGRPELDRVEAERIARVEVCEVVNVPNPESTHGMEGENPAVVCPLCNGPMKRRSGRSGPFWGCANYPSCRGSRQISR